MYRETKDLSETLAFTIGVVLQSDPYQRKVIASACQQAKRLVATIPLDNGDARSRIFACRDRFTSYKTINEVACAGWMLVAIQERVNEQSLPNWRMLHQLVRKTVEMLPIATSIKLQRLIDTGHQRRHVSHLLSR